MKTEPSVIVSLVAAILGLAAAFGLPLTLEQTAAVMAVVTILAGLVIRQNVTPQARADQRAQAAYEDVEVNDHPGNPFGAQGLD